MTLRTTLLCAGPTFWRTLSQHMLAAQTSPDLSRVQVIVASHTHTNALLKAFGAEAIARGTSVIPPRIQLLKDWLFDQTSGLNLSAPAVTPTLQVQSEIYVALRNNRWIRENFGDTPPQLWSLARTLTLLCDQLCFAAHQHPEDFDFAATLEHTVIQHYQNTAQHIVAAEARIVLDIWQALSATWPANQQLQQMQALLQQPPITSVWWISPHSLPAWQAAFLQQLGRTTEVTCIEIDYASTLAQTPLYAASWPHHNTQNIQPTHPSPHRSTDCPTPSTLRARAQAAQHAPLPSLTIKAANTLEQEAQFIAEQIVHWLSQGEAEIALVALDRLTTRRVRALLERAHILVRDETGWRLSTTSACGAVMRWFDVVRNQGYFRDVLDWLQSPFVLSQQNKHAALRLLQAGLAEHGVIRGWNGLLHMLSNMQVAAADQDTLQQLRTWFTEIHAHAQQFEKFSGTVSEHLARLQILLNQFGMQESLTRDPVGQSILQQLQRVGHELQGQTARLQLAEFRALLAHCFEQSNDHQETIESPLTIVSLRGAHLRSYRKVIVVGASADLLPVPAPEMLFLGDALCTELNLPTQAQERAEQFECWLTLLTGAQQIIATWRSENSKEPQVLSPWLAQYRTVAKLAKQLDAHDDVMQPITLVPHTVTANMLTQPCPQASGYWPNKVSASRYQALVDCPYRYFARSILGLQVTEEVSETAEQRERGQAIHQILENFHRTLAQSPQRYSTQEAQAELLKQQSSATFASLLERAPDFLAYQMEFEHLIPDYLQWLHVHQAAGWQWQRAEESLSHALAHAEHNLLLHGRIDRIDVQHTEAGHKTALIDYKITNADTLKKRLKTAGEEIQLPFYALLAQAPDCSASYLSLQRENVRELAPPYDIMEASRHLATRLMQDFVRIHAGASMPAQGDERTCTYCEMRGLCRRDEWKTESEHGA